MSKAETIYRTIARAQGLKRFFTGEPCRHGHVSERWVNDGKCIECGKVLNAKFHSKNPEKHKGYMRKYYEANSEKLIESSRNYHQNNPEIGKKAAAKWRRNNLEKARENTRNYMRDNVEKAKEWSRKWYYDNPERCKENNRRWREENQERIKETGRAWRQSNPEKMTANSMRRHAGKLQRTPAWVNHDDIAKIYAFAKELEKATGVKQHVDHIYPLRGKTCSGLHVAENLQVLPATANLRKHNKHPEELR